MDVTFRPLDICLLALMTGLIVISGFFKIPFFPVPVTLQTLFVYLTGNLLGRKGTICPALYLILGLSGLPVFVHGGGPGYLLRPTIGYLLAFPLAVWLIGSIQNRAGRIRLSRMMIANAAGMVLIFSLGCTGLYVHLNHIIARPSSFLQVLYIGAIVFIPGELVKLILSAIIARKICIGVNQSAKF